MMILRKVLFHPALLFAAGNTALALGYAEAVAISANIALLTALLAARSIEIIKKKPFGIPFTILAAVNFVTAGSIVYVNLTDGNTYLLAYAAALAYVAWGVGHLFAAGHERRASTARKITENPQTFYGIGDMAAVNASGSLNPLSFPFMVAGFIKSMFIGRNPRAKHKALRFISSEVTSARLYGSGFFVGALTSVALPYFAVAQICWGLAYIAFKKDT